ncbi:hypothetical protein AWB91_11675 [Mycobacterium paraense]|uniref:Acetaldehyde dehydrogenase C-terminal domain-containing protein n=1 Tax=Mycobacterium paraense TaxID=767916 RepID=A0ABX3VS04_9MYCO|nr:hypothetical protein AWB91_11675 [Mycobacterium paraense]ORW37936.1 hypothetical protein AWB88_01560 [Mycobacterium paraense]
MTASGCGGQLTVQIVAAVGKAGIVRYAEVVLSIPAKSAGPEIRASIDELVETAATGLQVDGGAQRGKAVIILNPADPPVPMRNTVYCLVDGEPDRQAIEREILDTIDRIAAHGPSLRLKQDVQFEVFGHDHPLYIPETGRFTGTRVTVLLEVAGPIAVRGIETAGATT